MSKDKQAARPDALRGIYRDAVAQDRGPSVESSAAILAHARQQAKVLGQKARESERPRVSTQPAANDRHWLRHALGGLAAVGLVGWLMLQHTAWWGGTEQGAEPAGDAALHHSSAPAAAPSSAEISAEPADAMADSSAAAVAPASSANRPAPASAPPAPNKAKARADAASQESAEGKAQLPPCPPDSETKHVKPDTSGQAAVAEVEEPVLCSPRKPLQAHETPAKGASQKRAPGEN